MHQNVQFCIIFYTTNCKKQLEKCTQCLILLYFFGMMRDACSHAIINANYGLYDGNVESCNVCCHLSEVSRSYQSDKNNY